MGNTLDVMSDEREIRDLAPAQSYQPHSWRFDSNMDNKTETAPWYEQGSELVLRSAKAQGFVMAKTLLAPRHLTNYYRIFQVAAVIHHMPACPGTNPLFMRGSRRPERLFRVQWK